MVKQKIAEGDEDTMIKNAQVAAKSILCCVYILLYLKEQIMDAYFLKKYTDSILYIILFILGAARQQRLRTAKKQKVVEGDEMEIRNITEIATKSIICCYIGT